MKKNSSIKFLLIVVCGMLIFSNSCEKNNAYRQERDNMLNESLDLLKDRIHKPLYFSETDLKSSLPLKVVFSTWSPETKADIYVINSDGTNLTQLTDYGENERYATWFPNGHIILYARMLGAETDTYDIFSMNSDGSDQKNLSDYPGPDWGGIVSPNNQKVLFISKREGNGFYIMSVDGSDCFKLTNLGGYERHPSWSPNSKQILFGHGGNIYTVNADGTNLKKIIESDETYWYAWARWSPNGQNILFDKYSNIIVDEETQFVSDVCVMNLHDGTIRNLTNNNFLDYCYWYSPNGQKILLHTNRNDKPEFYIMNADGSDPYYLMDFDPAFWPFWLPNGDMIYHKDQEILCIEEDGTDHRVITDIGLDIDGLDLMIGRIN